MKNSFEKIEEGAQRDPAESSTLVERNKAERQMEALRGKVTQLKEMDIKQAEDILEMIKAMPEDKREEKLKAIAPKSMEALEKAEDAIELGAIDIHQGQNLVDRFSKMSVEEIEHRLESLQQIAEDLKEKESEEKQAA
ncbi:MAG: hypothetical protein AAB796_00530 [Patescibacteria group bacterium]